MVQPTVDQFESVDLVVTYDENDNFVLGADVGWGETGQAMADQGAGFDGGTSSTATKKGGSGRTLYSLQSRVHQLGQCRSLGDDELREVAEQDECPEVGLQPLRERLTLRTAVAPSSG